MKTNEITEGNQLIAEFMGITDDKGWYDGFLIDKAGLPFSCGAMGNGTRKLNFNSSWDWLMPVVEKIENSGFDVNVKGISCSINRILETKTIIQFVCGERSKKIELVWLVVVEFIKWYNENK